jgi:hypothetical protein
VITNVSNGAWPTRYVACAMRPSIVIDVSGHGPGGGGGGGGPVVVLVVGAGEADDDEDAPAAAIVPLVGGEDVRRLLEVGTTLCLLAMPCGSAGEPWPSQLEMITASSTTSSTEHTSAITRRRQYTDGSSGPVGSIMHRP